MSTTCDILKGLQGSMQPVIVSIPKDSAHTEKWDWRGCVDGSGGPQSIRYVRFYVTKPRNKNGQQQALKQGSVATTGMKVTASGSVIVAVSPDQTVLDFHDVSNCEGVITVRNITKQTLDIELSYTCIIGG